MADATPERHEGVKQPEIPPLLQVLGPDLNDLPMADWQRLAEALLSA